VLSGQFVENNDTLVGQSWLRLPMGSAFKAKSGSEGTKVWIKRHNLAQVDAQIAFLSGHKK
jgi:hypothetical protein